MPTIDFIAVATPNFIRPELLRHGTIPQPLFGTAPRHVLGSEWWDETRRAAYIKNNMRCWACGGEGPLEAHEAYDINYRRAKMTYVETVSLCSDCHSFIHIGRLVGMFARGEISSAHAKRVVVKGYKILRKAGLKCPWEIRLILGSRLPWKGSHAWIYNIIADTDDMPDRVPSIEWSRWRLVIGGKEYRPRYDSLEEFKKEVL